MKHCFTFIALFLLLGFGASAQSPTINAVYPSNALPGSTVTISGTNFTGTTSVVFENGPDILFTVVSATQISAQIPLEAGPLKWKLLVSTPKGIAAGNIYINQPPSPEITSFSPASVVPGGTVTITGKNLSYIYQVLINDFLSIDFTVNSSTSITARIPIYGTTGKITLISAGNAAFSTEDLTIVPETAPAINSFSPASGTIGTTVTITGSNFQSAKEVYFNDASVPALLSQSATSITVTVPFGATTGKIKVVNSGGSATSVNDFTINDAPAPTITSFTPSSGQIFSEATITGTNFLSVYELQLDGIPFYSFIVNSPTSITFIVPAMALTGKLSVLTGGGTAVSSNDFTSTNPPSPVITTFTPESAEIGSLVTITGNNLSYVTDVYLEDQYCNIVSVSPTSVTVRITGAATGKFRIYAFGEETQSTSDFTATMPSPPAISSFSPASGFYNTPLTITGVNFSTATQVRIGNSNPSYDFTINSPTSISIKVPWGAASGPIAVTTAGGMTESAGTFTVTSEGAPSITSISPTSGPEGTLVTITGTNLLSTFHLIFNDLLTEDFAVNSATSVTVKVPMGATTGKIRLQNSYTSAESPAVFTVSALAAPTLTSFSPSGGAEGTAVTITGTNLLPTYYILFNGTETNQFTVNSATSVSVNVPAGATTGKLTIVTAGGTAVSSGTFTLAVSQPPTISSFSPASGAAGSMVTITGTDLSGTTSVKFNNAASVNFTINSSTSITAKVPSGATTGKISVTTPVSTALSSTDFTVTTPAGVSGTYLLKDIVPGSASSSALASNYVRAGDLVYFSAVANGVQGGFYKTDGTTAGTEFLTMVPNRISYDPYFAKNTVDFNGKIAFTTFAPSNQQEVWVSDGTSQGTVKLPKPEGTGSFLIHDLTVFNNDLYFAVEGFSDARGIYKWNGTALTKIIAASDDNYGDDLKLRVGDNKLFHANHQYIYDLSSGSPVTIYNQALVNSTRIIDNLVYFNGKLLFNEKSFQENNHGIRMLDPISKAYSFIIEGLDSGFESGAEHCNFMAEMGGDLYYYRTFVEYVNSTPVGNAFELWKINTSFQTSLVKKIPTEDLSNRHVLLANSSKLVFSVSNSAENWSQLWVSDGTPSGTTTLIDLADKIKVSDNQRQYFMTETKLLFLARDINASGLSNQGDELWKSDFTIGGTELAVEFASGNFEGLMDNSNFAPVSSTAIVTSVYYRPASTNVYGYEPWVTDGSPISFLGTKDRAMETFELSPNPTNGIFTIDLEKQNVRDADITVYNAFGETVYQSPLFHPKSQIDLTGHMKGVYFIYLKSADKVLVSKVVVQ